MGEGGDDAFGWSAWIPVLTCGGEMDKLRCPNFPCDYSNCVIMEVGAEWSSVDGQKYKAPGFMPPPPYRSDGHSRHCGHDVAMHAVYDTAGASKVE